MNPTDYGDQFNALASQYQPQTDLINSQIAALPGQQAAQASALDQAKVNAFKDITNSANSKGVLFSGVPIDQQSTYVGTKYLPALADLNTSFNNTKNTLLGQINSLNSDRSKQAQGNISAYQAEQAKEAYQNAQLQLSYAKLGASQSAAANKPLTSVQLQSAIRQNLQTVAGGNGKVSPQDYAQGLKDWLQAGLTRADYNKQMNNFRDSSNGYYDYAIKQAGL